MKWMLLWLVFLAACGDSDPKDKVWLDIHAVGCRNDRIDFVGRTGELIHIEWTGNHPTCNSWNTWTYWDVTGEPFGDDIKFKNARGHR